MVVGDRVAAPAGCTPTVTTALATPAVARATTAAIPPIRDLRFLRRPRIHPSSLTAEPSGLRNLADAIDCQPGNASRGIPDPDPKQSVHIQDRIPRHRPCETARRWNAGSSATTSRRASSTRRSSRPVQPRPHYERLSGSSSSSATTSWPGGPTSATPPSAPRASPSPSAATRTASSAPSRWTCSPGSSRPTSGRSSRRASPSGSAPSTSSSTTSTPASRPRSATGSSPATSSRRPTGFAREAMGIHVPHGARCVVAGIDLVRDAHGMYRVLEDNVRNPSGISYVLENRAAVARILPRVLGAHAVRRVDDYGPILLSALRAIAPSGGSRPRIVGAHPGPVQLRVLRARLRRPPARRRAGGGARPRGRRPRRLHAHHQRPRASRRDLPPHRRPSTSTPWASTPTP